MLQLVPEEMSPMSALTKPTNRISATEARVHFGEIYRRVTENDETIIVDVISVIAACYVRTYGSTAR